MIEEHLFRDIMAGFPAGVTVVTATGSDGSPHGLTVTAFASLSLKPPLVLVAVDEGARTLRVIRQTRGFTVNFLAAGNADVSVRFAQRERDRFEGIEWDPPTTPTAGPLLRNVTYAHIECTLGDSVKGGDHAILVGEVQAGWMSPGAEPLVHWQRHYPELLQPT